jgi:hypothetical protein
MQELSFWIHTCPRRDRRVRTRHRLAEEVARRQLIEPERVEAGALRVDPDVPLPAGHWRSGLVRRGDGVLIQPGSQEDSGATLPLRSHQEDGP